MDFRILGPLEVLDEGRAVAIGGSKQRALLAVLLLHANETLSTDRLIEELWGERAPATATKTVHVHVSRLRKALATGANGSNGILLTRDRGYQLKVDPECLDSLRFERLVEEGRSELAAGRTERAAATLGRALALWRGRPLGDLAYELFAEREAARLEELRIGAVEELIDAKLALGRHAEVLGTIDALIAEHPYRERLSAQKMLALYRSDRQADALQVFQDARVRLVKDLGIEPGERLRRLERAVLAQDPALALPPPLPPELRSDTPLAGRDAELERLREHWRTARTGDGRVVLLTGPPGIGKTRLAAELAMEVHSGGVEVRYGTWTGTGAGRPALLVLDDVDTLDELSQAVAAQPVLAVATARVPLPRADETLTLAPLDAAGVRALASEYARAGDELPVERLAAASGAIPRRLHRLAREWAQDMASRRLGRSAARAEEERAGLRSAEAELADEVVNLRSLDEPAGAPRVVACPFKGLASFDVDDADVFFGRERLVAELVARLVGAPLMGVVGPSGSGKSSALRAGLLAALAAGVLPGSDGWRLCLLRPGEHPVRALDQATRQASSGRMVVAVDQFEEVFNECRDESERAAFIERLMVYALDARSIVVVAVRADFYGRCAAYPELARALAANHVLVGPMRRDELRRAIELPARGAGLHVDAELVDALVDDVEGEPGALPLLSTTLLELWRHRDGRRLALGVYEQSGGVHGAVARLAESTYARFGDEQREIARRILMRLSGDGEGDAVVRRRVDIAELGAQGDGAIGKVLSVLAAERLVTIGEGEVEVAHEALLREWPRLRSWLEEDAQGRRLHRHLSTAAREWDARGRDPAELYRGARLASVLDWATTHEAELNTTERAFVEESRAASERSHRRLRAVLAGVCALLVLAVVAGIIALGERSNARDEAVFADAQRLGARALVENDFDRALLLARQGVALDDRVETRSNLLATLLKSPAAIGIMRAGGDERFWSLALSPDGRTLAAGDEFGRLVLFDVRTRRPLATLEPTSGGQNDTILRLVFSRDGRFLALSYVFQNAPTESVAVLDVRSRRVVRTLSKLDGNVGLMRFSDHGRTLDVEVANTSRPVSYLNRFDIQSGRPVGPPVQISRFPALAWPTSDERRIVVSGEDGTTIRDATAKHVLRRFPRGFRDEDFWTALSPDGRTLAAGGQDGSLRLMDLRTGRVRTASGRHSAPVGRGIVFTRDGRRVITPGEDGAVIVWDVRTAAVAETFTGHGGAVRGLAVTPDGRTLYSAGADGSVFIWDLAGDRRLGRPFTAGSGNEGSFPRYALSSDGRLLAQGQGDGRVNIIDARTLARLRSFPVTTTRGVPHEFGVAQPEVLGMRFLPRSHLLVVGGFGGFLAIVDTDSGRILRRLRGHRSAVYTPAISTDGRLMVTNSFDQTVRFWSLPDGRPLGAPLRFTRIPVAADLSPDGRWAVVVTEMSDRLQIIDARTHETVSTVKGHEGLFLAQFSHDGRLLAVGDQYGRTEVWSTATWRPITRAFAGQAGSTQQAAISPDDRTLATGSSDGTVRLWDIKTQQPLGAPLPGLPEHKVIPFFTPDGTALIAAYDIGRAYRWDIRPASLIRQACRVAGRRLTRAEWQEFLPGRNYEPAC